MHTESLSLEEIKNQRLTPKKPYSL